MLAHPIDAELIYTGDNLVYKVKYQGQDAVLKYFIDHSVKGLGPPTRIDRRIDHSQNCRSTRVNTCFYSERTDPMSHEAVVLQQASQIVNTPVLHYSIRFFSPFLVDGQTVLGAICMQFVQGILVDDLLGDQTWTLRERLSLCADMIRVVKKLHAAGILHGDLYPKNWMLSFGQLYLIDFGGGQLTTPEKASKDVIDLFTLQVTLTCVAYNIADWDFAQSMLEKGKSRFAQAQTVDDLLGLI